MGAPFVVRGRWNFHRATVVGAHPVVSSLTGRFGGFGARARVLFGAGLGVFLDVGWHGSIGARSQPVIQGVIR